MKENQLAKNIHQILNILSEKYYFFKQQKRSNYLHK